jgi:hypothetical protein
LIAPARERRSSVRRSDIVAGQAFGSVIAFDLMQNAAFRSEYDAAAAELKAIHLICPN